MFKTTTTMKTPPQLCASLEMRAQRSVHLHATNTSSSKVVENCHLVDIPDHPLQCVLSWSPECHINSTVFDCHGGVCGGREVIAHMAERVERSPPACRTVSKQVSHIDAYKKCPHRKSHSQHPTARAERRLGTNSSGTGDELTRSRSRPDKRLGLASRCMGSQAGSRQRRPARAVSSYSS